MIEYLGPILQGVAQALGGRLLENRSRKVRSDEIREVIEQVNATQKEVADVREVLRILVAFIAKVDGLRLDRDELVFIPTASTKTLPEALMELDSYIDTFVVAEGAEANSSYNPAGPAGQGSVPERTASASVLSGIDEEIHALRRGRVGGGT